MVARDQTGLRSEVNLSICQSGKLSQHAAASVCPQLAYSNRRLRRTHKAGSGLQVQRCVCKERAGPATQLEPQCQHPPCCTAGAAVRCETASHASCHTLACHQGSIPAANPCFLMHHRCISVTSWSTPSQPSLLSYQCMSCDTRLLDQVVQYAFYVQCPCILLQIRIVRVAQRDLVLLPCQGGCAPSRIDIQSVLIMISSTWSASKACKVYLI